MTEEYYYDRLWNFRSEFMQKLISSGETHPLRIIKKLESFDRFHTLNVNPDGSVNCMDSPADYKEARKQKNISFENRQLQISSTNRLPTGLNLSKKIPILDRHLDLPKYFSENLMSFLVDYLHEEKFDAIVELGAGYGQNLIELFYIGGPKNIPYYAGEYTNSGVRTAKMLSELCKDFDLIPFQFDYTKPDLSAVKERGKILIFSCHSIEQVEVLPKETLSYLGSFAKDVTCIHFEPFGYQMPSGHESEVDQKQRELFEHAGWNKNLFEVLFISQLEGKIDLQYLLKNFFGGHEACPTSLAIWKSISK